MTVSTVPRVRERWLRPTPPGCEHHGGADGEIRVIQQGEHLRDLLVRDEPGARGLLSNLLEIRPSQARTWRSPLPDGHVALHAQVDQAVRPQPPIQAPAPGRWQFPTACGYESALGRQHLPIERSGSSSTRRIPGVDQAWVEIGDQHMAGLTAALCQPCRDRPSTPADFPALPPWADAGSL